MFLGINMLVLMLLFKMISWVHGRCRKTGSLGSEVQECFGLTGMVFGSYFGKKPDVTNKKSRELILLMRLAIKTAFSQICFDSSIRNEVSEHLLNSILFPSLFPSSCFQ